MLILNCLIAIILLVRKTGDSEQSSPEQPDHLTGNDLS